MRTLSLLACLLLLAFPHSATAQSEPSSWGVAGTFVPGWYVPSSFEAMAAWHFSEDELSIEAQDLKGSEFRIGIVRGRASSGDWGVSFVRRTFDDVTTSSSQGGGCLGSTVGGVFVQDCEDFGVDMTRRDATLNGIEVHKFIPFVTIRNRVQIGVNVAGGFGVVGGEVDLADSRTTFRCTYPPGVFPNFDGFDGTTPFGQCAGATISNVQTTQTGAVTDEFSRFLKNESGFLPIGRAELAVAVIATDSLKVRVGGGLNYPGVNAFTVTGIYFFR